MDAPKRKYTVTGKVLAANRANLVKARAVPEAIRFRMTEKRARACRANLLKGLRAMKSAGDQPPAYRAAFRRGLYCASLGRSLELAGESRGEYEAHLKLFDWALAPRDAFERKVTRALAGATWRRLRGFRGQRRWERERLEAVLGRAARGEFWSRDWVETQLDHDREVRDEILRVFESGVEMAERLEKLDRRVEQLLRGLQERVNPGGPRLGFLTWRGPSRRWLQQASEAALGNPFRSAREVAQALAPKPFHLAAVKRWEWDFKTSARLIWDGSRLRLEHDVTAGVAPGRPFGPAAVGKEVEEPQRFAPYGTGQRWGASVALPDFESLARQFEAAFRLCDSKIETRKSSAPGEFRSSSFESRPPGFDFPVSRFHFPVSNFDFRSVAEAAWERLALYRRRVEEEAEALKRILEAAVGGRARGVGRQVWMCQMAEKIVFLFAGDTETLSAASSLEARLEGQLDRFLMTRHGELAAGLEEEPVGARRAVPPGEVKEGEENPASVSAPEDDPGSPAAPFTDADGFFDPPDDG